MFSLKSKDETLLTCLTSFFGLRYDFLKELSASFPLLFSAKIVPLRISLSISSWFLGLRIVFLLETRFSSESAKVIILAKAFFGMKLGCDFRRSVTSYKLLWLIIETPGPFWRRRSESYGLFLLGLSWSFLGLLNDIELEPSWSSRKTLRAFGSIWDGLFIWFPILISSSKFSTLISISRLKSTDIWLLSIDLLLFLPS